MKLILNYIEYPLYYILEFSIIFYTLKKIFLIPLTSSKAKQYFSIAISFLWLLYTFLSPHPLPQTFIILPVCLMVFTEHPAIISFITISETLVINTAPLLFFHPYCIITHTSHDSLANTYFTLATIVLILIILIKLHTKISFSIELLKKLKKKHFALIFFVICVDFFLSMTSSLLFFSNLNQLGRRLLTLAIYIMILLSVIILILYFRIIHMHSELEQISNMKSKMLSLEEQHYKYMLKKNTDLRAFRHDYNYHITSMQALAQNNDFTALKTYVNNLTETKAKMYFISTNNTIADAIINYFYENLPEDTDFKIDGKFTSNTFVNNSDLCTILSNLLRNAYEAICHIDNIDSTIQNHDLKTKKQLYISLTNDENNITIYITNTYIPYNQQNNSIFTTSKSDTINHGFGLQNVENTIKKYNGKLELTTNDNTFSAYVFLHNTL